MPATISAMQPSRAALRGLREQDHAEDRDADRADPGPDRVGGADRQRPRARPRNAMLTIMLRDRPERRHSA